MHPIKSAMAGFCLLVCLMARSEGIKFDEGSWQELTAKAQSEQKFIFVDFYADWCGPYKSGEVSFPGEELIKRSQ